MTSHTQLLPNIYIVGFMGTGKTTLGRTVAKKLDFKFIDTDKGVEKMIGCSVVEIFEKYGEEYFRKTEREFMLSGHPLNNCVVSCGGGLPLQPGMPEILQQRGIVICLFASPAVILSRVQRTAKRPLLFVEDPLRRIEELLEERMPTYLSCGINILTDGRTVSEIAANIERVYKQKLNSFLASHP